MAGASQLGPPEAGAVADTTAGPQCGSKAGFSGLSELPPQTLLAGIEIGAPLLSATPHSALAGGYHRSKDEMRDLIAAFTGDPQIARRLMAERGIGLIVYCSGSAEAQRYLSGAPAGLLARLERGHVPDWLARVEVQGSGTLRVFRVRRSAAAF